MLLYSTNRHRGTRASGVRPPHYRAALAAAIILFTCTAALQAQNVWTASGLAGRSVSSLATAPAGWILAATDTGIYRSTDAGATWTITGLTKTSRGVVVTSTGEAFASYNTRTIADGFAHSTDGGLTWQLGTTTDYIRTFTLDRADQLLMGTLSTITRSTDAGAHWKGVSRTGMSDDFYDIMQIAVGPQGEIIAGNAGITGGLVYASGDDGETWIELYHGTSDVRMVASAPTGTIFLAYQGIFLRSANGGAEWTQPDPAGAGTITAMAFRGTAAYAVGTSGVVRSDDDGVTWVSITEGLPAGTTIANIGIAADGTPLLATDSGVFRARSAAAVPGTGTAGSGTAIALSPNPARGLATIAIDVPATARLRATALDELGNQVAIIADELRGPGRSVLAWNVAAIAAGSYRVRVEMNGVVTTIPVMVVH